MNYVRATNGYDRLTPPNLVFEGRKIVTAMTGNTSFPSPIPSLTNVSVAIDDLATAIDTASGGDSYAITIRNAKFRTVVEMLHNITNYVMFTAAGDRDKVTSAGISVVKTRETRQISTPTGLTVVNGGNKGTLKVKVKAVKGAVAYIHQYTTDPNMAPDSWHDHTCSASRCMFTGLQSGTTYYVRVAAIGANNQLMYSTVDSIIVL